MGGGCAVEQLAFVVLDESPFYGRGGGQVGDTGRLETDDGAVWQVVDTTRPVASLTVLHVRAHDPSTPPLAVGCTLASYANVRWNPSDGPTRSCSS